MTSVWNFKHKNYTIQVFTEKKKNSINNFISHSFYKDNPYHNSHYKLLIHI